jgi:ribose 5-phosphate isomerase B
MWGIALYFRDMGPMVQHVEQKRVILASDHAGVSLKALLYSALEQAGYKGIDLGPYGEGRVDYPLYAHKLVAQLQQGQAEYGVLICGTGIGMSIAANRFAGIRAALCHDVSTARLSREHNDANILVLGARVIGPDVAQDALRQFLATPFAGGRHNQRLALLDLQEKPL